MIDGGALVQERDAVTEGRDEMKVVSSREPTLDEWRDLMFAWIVAARVKSNAIVLAKERATVGIGAGQIEKPEIHRILAVAEDEVGLAGAGRHLRRNLDRDRVGEL